MAFDKQPDTWIDNWSEDATDITVPIATFTELTAAEADGTSGDIRKILFALCEKFYDEWNGRDSADLPTQMTISKSASINASTGVITNTYTFLFYCEIGTQEVADES